MLPPVRSNASWSSPVPKLAEKIPGHARDRHGLGLAVDGRAVNRREQDLVGGRLADLHAGRTVVSEGQITAYQAGGDVSHQRPAFQRFQRGAIAIRPRPGPLAPAAAPQQLVHEIEL